MGHLRHQIGGSGVTFQVVLVTGKATSGYLSTHLGSYGIVIAAIHRRWPPLFRLLSPLAR